MSRKLTTFTLTAALLVLTAVAVSAQEREAQPTAPEDGPKHTSQSFSPQTSQKVSGEAPAQTADDQEAARRHYFAGYDAGYARGYGEGYDEGYDDSVLWFAEQRRGRRHSPANRTFADESFVSQDRGRDGGDQQDDPHLCELSGQVTDTKVVPIRGTSTSHLVVRLKTAFGRQHVVDLGPQRNLEGRKVEEGAQLAVQGHVVETPDMLVIAASRVCVDGNVVDVQYRQPERVREAAEKADEAADREDAASPEEAAQRPFDPVRSEQRPTK